MSSCSHSLSSLYELWSFGARLVLFFGSVLDPRRWTGFCRRPLRSGEVGCDCCFFFVFEAVVPLAGGRRCRRDPNTEFSERVDEITYAQSKRTSFVPMDRKMMSMARLVWRLFLSTVRWAPGKCWCHDECLFVHLFLINLIVGLSQPRGSVAPIRGCLERIL